MKPEPLPQAVWEWFDQDDFSRSASAAMPGDNRGMAATAEEGTAHKLVTCKCGRTMPNSEDRGDSRKDGTSSAEVNC